MTEKETMTFIEALEYLQQGFVASEKRFIRAVGSVDGVYYSNALIGDKYVKDDSGEKQILLHSPGLKRNNKPIPYTAATFSNNDIASEFEIYEPLI
jgi:hypothetical protein